MSDIDEDTLVYRPPVNQPEVKEFEGLDQRQIDQNLCRLCVERSLKGGKFLTPEDEQFVDNKLRALFRNGFIQEEDIMPYKALMSQEPCYIVSQFAKEVLQDQIGSNVRNILLRIGNLEGSKLSEEDILKGIIESYGNHSCVFQGQVKLALLYAILNFNIPVIRTFLEHSRRVSIVNEQ